MERTLGIYYEKTTHRKEPQKKCWRNSLTLGEIRFVTTLKAETNLKEYIKKKGELRMNGSK